MLAEYTQPFNETDITYFRPLYQQTVVALNQFPTHIIADAAYDAWYVYERTARHGGIAAVPLTEHRKTPLPVRLMVLPFAPSVCPCIPPRSSTIRDCYRAQRFQCPLLFPAKTGKMCDHEQFAKGKGCVKDVNWKLGAIQRVTLDRDGPYTMSSTTNAPAVNASTARALGIETPKVRNGRSAANLDTLIYVIINVQVLKRSNPSIQDFYT